MYIHLTHRQNCFATASAALREGRGSGLYPLYATSTNGSTWTTPAAMNGSTSRGVMRAVTVNSSGLFVSVGSNNLSYPLYVTSK